MSCINETGVRISR